jgi:NYN domain
MTTNVYVDGFNLYYGAAKGTPYKWLDVVTFSKALLPRHDIGQVRYFTARVSARPGDPDQPMRQDTYLRALVAQPSITVHEGHFLEKETWMPLATAPANGSRMVKVIKTEEKGSDVNLATYLLIDGFRGQYDAALVISNDSDLTEPIRFVVQDLGLPVIVANPRAKSPSRQLAAVATYVKDIRPNLLARCQLPDPVYDTAGRAIHKPARW